MATLHPFRALRPNAANARPHRRRSLRRRQHRRGARAGRRQPAELSPRVARGDRPAGRHRSVRRRRLSDGPPTTSRRCATSALVVEDEPSVYFYRLQMGSHVQTGLAACFSHRRVRPRRHQEARAHAPRQGRRSHEAHARARRADRSGVPHVSRAPTRSIAMAATVTPGEPLIDFTAPDGVRHTLWRVGGADRDALVAAFGRIPALYIADGHHRAASAARARAEMRERGLAGTSLGDGADAVDDAGGGVSARSGADPVVQPHGEGSRRPVARRVPRGGARALRRRGRTGRRRRSAATSRCTSQGALAHAAAARRAGSDAIRSARSTSACCRSGLLAPVLKIADVRTDKRIDFVGGARGTAALETARRLGQGRGRVLALSRSASPT